MRSLLRQSRQACRAQKATGRVFRFTDSAFTGHLCRRFDFWWTRSQQPVICHNLPTEFQLAKRDSDLYRQLKSKSDLHWISFDWVTQGSGTVRGSTQTMWHRWIICLRLINNQNVFYVFPTSACDRLSGGLSCCCHSALQVQHCCDTEGDISDSNYYAVHAFLGVSLPIVSPEA